MACRWVLNSSWVISPLESKFLSSPSRSSADFSAGRTITSASATGETPDPTMLEYTLLVLLTVTSPFLTISLWSRIAVTSCSYWAKPSPTASWVVPLLLTAFPDDAVST